MMDSFVNIQSDSKSEDDSISGKFRYLFSEDVWTKSPSRYKGSNSPLPPEPLGPFYNYLALSDDANTRLHI